MAFILVLGCVTPSVVRAEDTSNPLGSVGHYLYLHDETFEWSSASVEGDYRFDHYISSSYEYSITVTTLVGSPNLATVSGSSPWGGVDGHISNGSYSDNYFWETDDSSYTSSYSYIVNLATGQILTASDYQSWMSYENSSESYHSWSLADGTSGWTESGSSWSEPNGETVTLFGVEFTLNGQSFSWENGEVNGVPFSNQSSSASYSSADGGDLSVGDSYNNTITPPTSVSLSGWDPHIGHFSASSSDSSALSNFADASWQWEPRVSPTFAPAVTWLNGHLLIWQGGTLNADGTVQDAYEDASGDQTLIVTGGVRDVAFHTSPAVLSLNGTTVGTVSGTINSGLSFSIEPGHAFIADPDEVGTPHFLPASATLWVNESPYSFSSSFHGGGSFADVYVNAALGSLILSGSGGAGGPAQVIGHDQTQLFSGSMNGGVFTVTGASVSSVEPGVELPEGIWVRGLLYLPTTPGSGTYHAGPDGEYGICQLTLDGSNVEVTGDEYFGSFTGAVAARTDGIFLLAFSANDPPEGAPTQVPAIFVKSNGDLRVSDLVPSQSHFPSSIRVKVPGSGPTPTFSYLTYLGTADDDTSEGTPALYYGCAATDVPERRLVKIHLNGDAFHSHDTFHSRYSVFPPETAEIRYNSTTFQFRAPVPSASQSPPQSTFPGPVYSVAVKNSYIRVLLPVSTTSGSPLSFLLPPTFIVRGEAWAYSGMDGNMHLYHGYYEGQEMRIPDQPNLADNIVATLTDPFHNRHLDNPNHLTEGIFAPDRRSIRFRDNTVALPGNTSGVREAVNLNATINLHTIQGDLDILGNNLSFGLLHGDGSLAGVLFQFQDNGTEARQFNGISRPQAEWSWWKSGPTPTADPLPVMRLRPDHKLHLTDPVPSTEMEPRHGITLDPPQAAPAASPASSASAEAAI